MSVSQSGVEAEVVGKREQRSSGMRMLGHAVRVLVTLAAFYYLSTLVNPAELRATLARVPLAAFVSAIGLCAMVLATGVYRWGLLLDTFGAVRRPSLVRLSQLYMVGLFYNMYLPGGVGGDVVRGLATRESFGEGEARGTAAGLSVVLVERVMGLSGLLVVVASASVLHPIAGVPEARLLGVLGLLGAASAITGLLFARRLSSLLPGVLGRLVGTLPVPAHYRALPAVFLLTLMAHVLVALSGHVLISALAPAVTVSQSLAIIPLASAAAFVPITVSGAGVREAVFVTLYGGIGVEQGAALAASLGLWGAQLFLGAIGGVVALLAPVNRP